jgi:5-methylthioribose kinase
VVLRVEEGRRRLVVKQSRPQLRTKEDWFSDLERIFREQEVMEALHPLLPAGVVPRVLHSDRASYVFVMEHAPHPSRVWKEMLLAGQADDAVARSAGRILGRIHQETGRRPETVRRFLDRQVFVQLRVEPFYQRIRERVPGLAPFIEPLIDEMMRRSDALCHGDFSPKNLLVHAGGLTLVDYETAHLGDPTMDLGFFFSHLLLKAVKHHPDHQRYLGLTESAWRGYAEEVRFCPVGELVRRGVRHLAVCLLARIDGTSPVDYLPEEPKRAAVRRLGRWLLQDAVSDWPGVLGRVEAELRGLEVR